jgi:hypothetical protein
LFDSRHRFVLSYEWALPIWRQPHGWYQLILGAWQLNGIATIMSGTPFTVFDSVDVSEQGSAPEITGFSANRPNLVPGQNPNSGPKTAGGVAQCSGVPAHLAGPVLTRTAVRYGRPQHRARTGLCRLGFLGV